jgi:hypothetical protein
MLTAFMLLWHPKSTFLDLSLALSVKRYFVSVFDYSKSFQNLHRQAIEYVNMILTQL